MPGFVEFEANEENRSEHETPTGYEAKEHPHGQQRLLALGLVRNEPHAAQDEPGQHYRYAQSRLLDEVPDGEVGAFLPVTRQVFVEIDDIGLYGGPHYVGITATDIDNEGDPADQPRLLSWTMNRPQ